MRSSLVVRLWVYASLKRLSNSWSCLGGGGGGVGGVEGAGGGWVRMGRQG